ncbi:MAG: hypothetical protein ACR2IP_08740 [Solirubrobacteraceae bacterium]
MLDPRIYRAGLVAVALAVIVLAFSLGSQQGALGTTIAPDAFNGQSAYLTLNSLARAHPDRRPGSSDDDQLAGYVAGALRHDSFSVSTTGFEGHTAEGSRRLQTVTAVRAGLSTGSSIVVLAHRDSLHSPATAELSGTATLLELARVLNGETLHRTIVLVSTSGSAGAAGAAQVARSAGAGADAVIVLGDLAGTRLEPPIVVPWSDGQQVAPPVLRNTLAGALASQAGLRPGGTGLAGQIAHLAFPLTVSEQGPFGARGEPSVLLSASGERGPGARAPVSPARIAALGRTVLQTVNALDGAPDVPTPSPYLLFDGKVIPQWALRVLALALILPVLGATIDGLARARRRGHSITRWVVWVLAGGLPFALALLLVLAAGASGLIGAAPPGPVGAGAVPVQAAGVVVLIAAALVIAVAFAFLRPLVIGLVSRAPGRAGGTGVAGGPGAAVALLAVMCGVSLAIWITNPLAAALISPALHLWMWVLAPDVRLRTVPMLALLIAGIIPPVLVAAYYANALELAPLGVVWNGMLLLAGGQVGLLAALEWSVVLGCAVSVVLIALRSAGGNRPLPPVTVRGPVTYAGPGSLGGTKSALRR